MKVINMGPGSGKTTSALKLCKKLAESSKDVHVIYITITNSAADEANTRLRDEYDLSKRNLNRVTTSTMHSYLLKILRDITPDTKIVSTTSSPKSSFSRVLPTRDINNAEEFLKKFNEEYRVVENNEVISITVPMDLLLDLVVALKYKPPDNHILVIDEFQDMYSREVVNLAKLFGATNVHMFGDTNQSLFQFRMKRGIDTDIEVDTPDVSVTRSFRLYQDSCDVLNRYLVMKKEISAAIGGNRKGVIRLKSAKGLNGNSISVLPRAAGYGDGPLPNIYKDDIRSRLQFPDCFIDRLRDKGGSFIIMNPFNAGARLYSKLAFERFGRENVYSWYEMVNYTRLYKDVRYLLSGENAGSTWMTLYDSMKEAAIALGYHIPTSSSSTFEKSARTRKNNYSNGDDFVTIDVFKERIGKLVDGEVPKKWVISERASTKANYVANVTILNMLLQYGLRCCMKAVRVFFDRDKVNSRITGGVFTVHAAKGMEADVVLLDLVNGIHIGESTLSAVEQAFNTVYVALSRHIEKLYVVLPKGLKSNLPLSLSNPFMKDYANYVKNVDPDIVQYNPHILSTYFSEVIPKTREFVLSPGMNRRRAYAISGDILTAVTMAALDKDEYNRCMPVLKDSHD